MMIWMPPRKNIAMVMKAQPGTAVSGAKSLTPRTKRMPKKLSAELMYPSLLIIRSGVTEKPRMPSAANRSILRSG
jgi:hypothetical protein